MRKIIFLFLLFFAVIITSGTSIAWEESLEGHWEELSSPDYSIAYGTIDVSEGPHTLRGAGGSLAAFEIYKNFDDDGYLRFKYKTASDSEAHIVIYDNAGNQVYDILVPINSQYNSWHQMEIIENIDHSAVTIYRDGNVGSTFTRKTSNASSKIYLSVYSSFPVYIDDVSSTSPFMIGTVGFISPSSGTMYATVTAPLENTYHMTLSKQSGEILNSWNITSKCQTISYSVNTFFSDDGFYYYDIYDADGKLYYSKLLYYNSLGVYPNSYFTIQSDTAADIRDHSLNGGLITGGGTVYLTPSAQANNNQDFSVGFQEPAYERELTLTKIFNTTTLDGSIISLKGLNPSVYNVSVDSVFVGSTNADTWAYTVDWIGDNSYIFELSPDFSSPGIWGYVKDSYTHENIPYAQLYTINSSYSSNIYADENGMYYLGGLYPGPYSIQASKKGYTSSSAQPFTASEGETTRKDIYLDSSGAVSGSGLYYATHDVTFTVLEYWYSHIGIPGVEYSIKDSNGTIKAEGYTDSKGKFAIEDMKSGTNYTFDLRYNGTNHTEYIMPSLTEYNIVLNNQSEILHQYYNNWLNLSYSENNRSIAISYVSNKSIAGAAVILNYSNGTIAASQSLNTQTGTFTFNNLPAANDYIINFNITSSDGEKASQSWVLSALQKVTLFPDSYPAWLKNTLFVSIILVFMLAFGKSKNDVACLSAAVLTSLGHFFGWLICPYYLVVLIWIIALSAAFLHYKRTGALG